MFDFSKVSNKKQYFLAYQHINVKKKVMLLIYMQVKRNRATVKIIKKIGITEGILVNVDVPS